MDSGSRSRAVIETIGLSKSYGKVMAVRSLSLSVPRHSIFAFLGPNGAGKSTTIKMLLGLTRPTDGSGQIFGLDIEKDSVRIRRRVGYLAQDPRFYPGMTVRQTLQFVARFFYSGPRRAVEKRIDEMLDLVGLSELQDRMVSALSGGERQRLGIAQAQVGYPDLLILDEPAASLDPLGRRDVLTVMERLRKHTTILYSTHILSDVQRVSDSVAIMNKGQLVAQAPIDELLSGSGSGVYTMVLRGDLSAVYGLVQDLPFVRSIQRRPLAELPAATGPIAAEKPTSGAKSPGDADSLDASASRSSQGAPEPAGAAESWTISVTDEAAAERKGGAEPLRLVTLGVELYSEITALFAAVGVVIAVLDAIVGERELGTAAFVLSKPVSRISFILSKFLANAIGILVTSVLIPGVVAYAEVWAIAGAKLSIGRFGVAMLTLFMGLAFYLALTLLLGALFKHKAPVVGIPLVLLFGQHLFTSLVPQLVYLTPWGIPNLVKAYVIEGTLTSPIPLIAVPLGIGLFLAIAILVFGHEDL